MTQERITDAVEKEGKYLISLLRSALRNEPPATPPAGLNWGEMFRLAKAHMVEATVYRKVTETAACPEELLEKWKSRADSALAKELLYDAERREILEIFDKEKIKYLPLKGILIKDFYPHKGMRQFSDNDVLIDKKKRRRIREIMLDRGYSTDKFVTRHSAHDVYVKLPMYNFEMHRDLFDESSSDKYFKKVWSRALKDEGDNSAYHMTAYDFYAYALAHFKKHYEKNGAGMRFFADIYLLRKNMRLDADKLAECLSACGVAAFESEVSEIAESWFGDEPKDIEKSVFDFIITSGVYGNIDNLMKNKMEQGGGHGLMKFIFLPYSEMKVRFPFLKYLPFLLPFCWIVRLLRAPFSKRKRQKARLAIKYRAKKDKK